MRKLIVLAVLAFGFTGASLYAASAQSKTCGAAYAACKNACKDAVASPNCPSWCANGMSSCKKTGCFPKAPRFGGGATCGLKQS
jgi:hypothetical protein